MKLTKDHSIDQRTTQARHLDSAYKWLVISLLVVAFFILARSMRNAPQTSPNAPEPKITPRSLVVSVQAQDNEPDEPHEVMAVIRQEGRRLGFDDYKITRFMKVARCESGYRPKAKNRNSTAAGVYQILVGTWEDNDCYGSRYNVRDNVNCAYKLLVKRGFQPWNASKSCWDK